MLCPVCDLEKALVPIEKEGLICRNAAEESLFTNNINNIIILFISVQVVGF
jgi:hypothetical protein